MDLSRDERLKDYLGRVLDAQRQAGRVLQEGELREIAYRVGLSDEDLAMADQKAHDRYHRGMEMLRTQRFDEALDAFADAVALSPGWLQYRLKLAEVYVARWRATGRDHDRWRAEELARECIEIDRYNDTARSILNATSKSAPPPQPQQQAPRQQAPRQQAPPPRAQRPQRPVNPAFANRTAQTPPNYSTPAPSSGGGAARILVLVFALIGVTTTGCIGLFTALLVRSPSEESSYDYVEEQPIEAPPIIDDALLDDIAALESAVALSGLVETTLVEGATLSTDEPLEVYSTERHPLVYQVVFTDRKDFSSGKTYFKSGLYFRWEGEGRVTKISGRYQFLSADGTVLATQSRLILSNLGKGGGLNPGEIHADRFIHEAPVDYDRAMLVIEQVETQPELAERSSGDYGPLKWSVEGPVSDVSVITHTSEFSDSLLKPGFGFYKLKMGVKYDAVVGQPIETMRAKIRSLDASGNVIQEDMWFIVGSLNLPLFPQEERQVKRTLSVPQNFDRAEIIVDKFGYFDGL